jgi:hypothetical protein
VLYVQKICIFMNARITDCVYGGKVSSKDIYPGCGCGMDTGKRCEPCCYLEYLGRGKWNATMEKYGSATDQNRIPPHPGKGCGSIGAMATVAYVRAIAVSGRLGRQMELDVSWNWKDADESCKPGCRDEMIQKMGPHIKWDTSTIPQWWQTTEFITDDFYALTRVKWDCCDKQRNGNQTVELPTQTWTMEDGKLLPNLPIGSR